MTRRALPIVAEASSHTTSAGTTRSILDVQDLQVDVSLVGQLAEHLLDGRCCSHMIVIADNPMLAAAWVRATRFIIVRRLADQVRAG